MSLRLTLSRCLVTLRPMLRFSSTLEPHQLSGQLASEKASKLPKSRKGLDTILSHAGVPQCIENAPMSPPLSMATTYTRPPSGIYGEHDYIYSRDNNPTKSSLEQTMAELECTGDDRNFDAAVSFVFSSGMASVNAIVTAHGASTTVLIPQDLYHGVPTLLQDVLQNVGVQYQRVNFLDMEELIQVSKSVTTDNVIVWIETPSNPQCQVLDIECICETLQNTSLNAALTTAVDSTMCPPTITQPLQLGADLVFHSGTKFLGGHSDVLLGVVTASPWTQRGLELGPMLREVQVKAGAVASSFDSWLTLRGLRTLHVRVERASQNALALAQFLDSQDTVKVTHYPGLATHPQHEIAKKQMKKYFGGVLSFEMETAAGAMAVAGALRTAQRATSLGGTETLVEHRASIEPPGRVVSPPGLLRVSAGLEDIDDLMDDFRTALEIARDLPQAS